MNASLVIHEPLMNRSRIILPRVGVGVGGRVRDGALLHASYLTDADPLAAASVPTDLTQLCKEAIDGWVR